MVAGAVLALAGTADGDLEVVGETDGSLSALGVANGDLRPVDAGEDAVDCCLLFCFLPREPRVLVPRFVMGLAARPLMENWSLFGIVLGISVVEMVSDDRGLVEIKTTVRTDQPLIMK